MRRIAKNSSLIDLAPHLVKEWHPSANGSLTPRNVKIVFSRKVWWICSQSHEWRAKINSRMKGHDCPLCRIDNNIKLPHDYIDNSASKNSHHQIKSEPRATAAIFEPDAFDENFGHDFRKSRRYKMMATAVIESPNTGHWGYADVKNFSAGGMSFE